MSHVAFFVPATMGGVAGEPAADGGEPRRGLHRICRTYKGSREEAREAFESVGFESEESSAIDSLLAATLARYDAEISWYDSHADRRRVCSAVVRFLAVALGTSSACLVSFRAFGAIGVSVEYAAIATVIATVAGGILLFDSVFQITRRYARWRVTEYAIRILRSDFQVEFLEEFGCIDRKCTRDEFKKAKVLCAKRFKEVQDEIKRETESWQGDLDKAMAAFQTRIDKTIEQARVASEDARKSRKDQTEREEAAKRDVEPVFLTVKVDEAAGRPDVVNVVVRDKREREVCRKDGVSPPRKVPFVLVPGRYLVRLLNSDGAEVEVKSVVLAPDKDEVLPI